MRKILLTTFIVACTLFCATARQTIIVTGPMIDNNTFGTAGARYVITQDITLNGRTITLPADCLLDFQGGSISSGTLNGNNTLIASPPQQIFMSSCRLGGTFACSAMPVEWFGATGDGVTDDAAAINRALKTSKGATVELANRNYKINSTLKIHTGGTKLRCTGTLLVNCDVGIEVNTSNIDLDIFAMRRMNVELNDPATYTGEALKLVGYCENGRYRFNTISGFDKAILLAPRYRTVNGATTGGGIQYCKFDFNHIISAHGIYFDLCDENNGHNLWVNENQFTGGRLEGKYGIFVKHPESGAARWDRLNGNVFNSIGFEGIDVPVKFYHAAFCHFNDIRMSESIHQEYLNLEDCRFMDFKIKSHVPYSKIVSSSCVQVHLYGSFTDDGCDYLRRYTRMIIDSPLNNGTQSDDVKLLGRDNFQIDVTKFLYYDNTTAISSPLTLDDLFVTTHDGEKLWSTNCELMCYRTSLPIDITNGLAKHLATSLTLKCELGNNCVISFVDGGTEAASITHSGVYRLIYNRDNELKVIEL